MNWAAFWQKVGRCVDVAGCISGGAGIAWALASYLYFAVAGPDAPYEDVALAGMGVLAVPLIIVMTGWKWRIDSSDRAIFYGSGLRRTHGALWRAFRITLWASFLFVFVQFILYGRKRADLGMTAIYLYGSCLMLFGSLYGVHAIALYRYSWELYRRVIRWIARRYWSRNSTDSTADIPER